MIVDQIAQIPEPDREDDHSDKAQSDRVLRKRLTLNLKDSYQTRASAKFSQSHDHNAKIMLKLNHPRGANELGFNGRLDAWARVQQVKPEIVHQPQTSFVMLHQT